MNMQWPATLLLLGLVPLIVAAYLWMLRRRRRYTIRFSSLALVREALPHQSRLRRHLPFALFLSGLTSLIFAMGRPTATVNVPTGQTVIILAIDVSRSMRATDIPPSRLQAAKAAALSFVQRQEANVQIGIVAFAGFAELIQTPTNDQEALETAIESLTLARRTAIGSGLLASLDAIAQINKSVAPIGSGTSSETEPTPVPEGAYIPDIVVLLTDGVSNSGPMPLVAAQAAVDRGVRVYTIGFGTDNGTMPGDPQQPQGGDYYFGGGGQDFGGGYRMGIDEETLKQIATLTGGEYYSATSAGELQSVFQKLPTYFTLKQEFMEISVAFTAIGALLAALAIGLSLIWRPLP